MSGSVGWISLVAVATAVDGLLAGASLDASIKQLPARHRIGVRAFSAYSRAADLGTGLFWYAALGISGALLTVAAAVWALAPGLAVRQSLPVLVAGGLAIAHSLTTARAAPINWSQRAAEGEPALASVFQRFERWQTVRVTLQLATFLAMIWALVINAGRALTG